MLPSARTRRAPRAPSASSSDADAHCLAERRVQVDEHPAAQEIVDLAPRGARARPSGAGARSVVAAEVVDVHVGEAFELGVDQVDHRRRTRRCSSARPSAQHGLVVGLAPVAEEQPEQELEPAGGLEERVSFEVEEDVAPRRPRQRREAASVLERPCAPLDRACRVTRELELGLLVQPGRTCPARACAPASPGRQPRARSAS